MLEIPSATAQPGNGRDKLFQFLMNLCYPWFDIVWLYARYLPFLLQGFREEQYSPVGFLRRQEERLAVRLWAWRYQKMNLPVPTPPKLEGQAHKLVNDAHRIARETGGNVMSIIKEMIEDLKKKEG